jgi:hypothetical protein
MKYEPGTFCWVELATKNTNYMYARFETDSDEYEKFFAALAQATQKAKTEKKPN